MAEACRELSFPVISGNVSLYNETNGQAILPTPAIGGVGILDNLERRATADKLQQGDTLVLIGDTTVISANPSTRATSSSSAAPRPRSISLWKRRTATSSAH
jgi:phosphoribosylformylglycinamidine (FGAM) synthase-like enzyme